MTRTALLIKAKVKIQKANVLIGLDIGQDIPVQCNTLLICSTPQSFMTKDLTEMKSWYRNQMEESIHMWNTATDHAGRNYWQGYSTAMKWAFHKLQTHLSDDDTTD